MRFFWNRRHEQPAASAPRPNLVSDGAGELGIEGKAAYSFNLRGGAEPVRLAERMDSIALIRRMGADVKDPE
jgi:hypothetical protein